MKGIYMKEIEHLNLQRERKELACDGIERKGRVRALREEYRANDDNTIP
jgi:hypothetical protein